MYVAVKGGEKAIAGAHRLLAEERRGDPAVPEISLDQIEQQLSFAVDRVMSEGSLYDPELAALAIKQARGDLVEAVFLLRAYRTTLPRFADSLPIDTADMAVRRRVSAIFKDLPGGQMLGPTFDYTLRLLDFSLMAEGKPADIEVPMSASDPMPADAPAQMPRVTDLLVADGILAAETDDGERPADITRIPLSFPADRATRLQALARGDEGFLLGLGYSTQRGYGRSHPFAGEIRMGDVAVELQPEELPFPIEIGDIELTECQMVNQYKGDAENPPQFTRGYGLAFGQGERKAMAMALVDRALRAEELGEVATSPAQDAEFVLSHCDNLEASGFVQHLKLPHYVDFQAELSTLRALRAAHAKRAEAAE
ncbi:alpha-D-ribose 1-methylphosphonate 5-triphosphate synthase subunit PhnI [Dongia mobilis]|uniref:Alpha-D-ribose 1-methylphosphonate 5-triphosphate synthase subunit PhnI n=1 Tax=Dongia mobilis TaxID=578943 RepID=A0A4R6X107_9PROT|nr:carbon-phosphorus lyase complex subunit PhnI [Dongia mobilis]TDQ84138.1 alpha-D-ribose 1-methylphosphonate 5-triphosphate synthase subunit PhnI [Dongia mobilis]